MWLPRLMRAANEEQIRRMHASYRSQLQEISPEIICECGHLMIGSRTNPFPCAQATPDTLKYRFAILKWCCITFLIISITLMAFSTLLGSASTKLSSCLVFFITLASVLIISIPCCLRFRSVSHLRSGANGLRSQGLYSYIDSLRWPSIILSQNFFSPNDSNDRLDPRSHSNLFASDRSGYNARLPTYQDAINTTVFAPPPYSSAILREPLSHSVLHSFAGNGRDEGIQMNADVESHQVSTDGCSAAHLDLDKENRASTDTISMKINQSDDVEHVECYSGNQEQAVYSQRACAESVESNKVEIFVIND